MRSARNIAFSLTNLLASMVSSFFLVPLLTSSMGVEAYGYVGIGQAFISIAMVFSIAITSLSTRFIVVAYHESASRAEAYFNSIFAACVMLALVLGTCFALAAANIESLVQISPELVGNARAMICFMAGSFCLTILACPFLSGQYFRGDLRAYYSLSALTQIVRIVVPSVMFGIVGPSLWLPYAASFSVDLAALFVYVGVFARFMPGISISKEHVKGELIHEVVASGMWSSVNKAGAIMLSSVSRYMANIILGALKAGYYAAFAQFQMLFASFTTAVVGALVPNMIKAYAQCGEDAFRKLYVKFIRYMAIALGALCGIALVYLGPFFELWVGGDVGNYAFVSAVMIAFLPLAYPSEVLNQVLIVEVRVKVPALVTLGFGVANLALMVFLCKALGMDMVGLAVAQAVILVLRSWGFLPLYVCKGAGQASRSVYGGYLYGPVTLCLSLGSTWVMSGLLPAASGWTLLFLDCLICALPVGLLCLLLVGEDGRKRIRALIASSFAGKDLR